MREHRAGGNGEDNNNNNNGGRGAGGGARNTGPSHPSNGTSSSRYSRSLVPPTKRDWSGIVDTPEYHNMKRLGHFNNRLSDWCQSRIRSQQGYELSKQLFAYDPDNRLTADQAIRHKWFLEDPLPT
jgi:hypothetical protein